MCESFFFLAVLGFELGASYLLGTYSVAGATPPALIYKPLCKHILQIFLNLRSEMSEWFSRCMFKFLRNCQSVFQTSCTILHSHQQCMRVWLVAHSCQYVVWLGIFNRCFSWLTHIPLKTNDSQHLFLCFWPSMNL
jgi:hypothetical protein